MDTSITKSNYKAPTPKKKIIDHINSLKRYIKNDKNVQNILQGIGIILLHVLIIVGCIHYNKFWGEDNNKFTTTAVMENKYKTMAGTFGQFTFELDGKKYNKKLILITNEFFITGVKNKSYQITSPYTEEIPNPVQANVWDIIVMMVICVVGVILIFFDFAGICFLLDTIYHTLLKWWKED